MAVSIGSSATVRVGAKVTAVGNAGEIGKAPTSTTGSVIALGRSITASDEAKVTSEHLTGLIETNAAIEPGDSGGALVSSAGKVVGMTTAASGFEFQPGGNEGFAIPITTAMTIGRQILASRFSLSVHRGATSFLGVQAVSSGYLSGNQFFAGVLVEGVVPASVAEKAGVVAGEVIAAVNATSITSPTALTNTLLALSPGAKARPVWVDSNGTSHTATVTLGSGPPQ